MLQRSSFCFALEMLFDIFGLYRISSRSNRLNCHLNGVVRKILILNTEKGDLENEGL